MYQVIITDKEAGQRLDKYLHRILPNAGSGFLYKMLRKKNITLNDKKAEGSEKIAAGDLLKIYFADDTLVKFKDAAWPDGAREYMTAYREIVGIKILYENDHVLLIDKPAGILSQKADRDDFSLNEWLIGYLLSSGFLSETSLTAYKPSVCNRLDRNTSGIVLCAKTLQGAQMLGVLLQDRTLHKYYQMYVKGCIEEQGLIEGYLCKDENHNKVSVKKLSEADFDIAGGREKKEAYIKTAYKPLRIEKDKTLLEAELFTGKSHQIRAHLASIGHPLLGDYKYGDRVWNEAYRRKYHVQSQLLHACRVVFPHLKAPFEDLSEAAFSCELPAVFGQVSDVTVSCLPQRDKRRNRKA